MWAGQAGTNPGSRSSLIGPASSYVLNDEERKTPPWGLSATAGPSSLGSRHQGPNITYPLVQGYGPGQGYKFGIFFLIETWRGALLGKGLRSPETWKESASPPGEVFCEPTLSLTCPVSAYLFSTLSHHLSLRL